MADDPRAWLSRRTAELEMERRVARAVLEPGGRARMHRNDPRRRGDASPGDLRGIPAIGWGWEGGAIRGTRPDHRDIRL